MIALLALALFQADAAGVADRINFHRKAAGVEPVSLDPDLSRGCASHAAYLVRNVDHPSTKGLGLHGEDPALPGYSKEGERAGKAAVIFLGLEGAAAVDGWAASLFHRIPLLDPRLKKIGFGSARGGPAGVTVVLDVTNGLGVIKSASVVVYPADQQADVPVGFFAEIPDPIPKDPDRKAGYPITASFWEGALVKDAKASLKDAAGNEVECWLSSPERPAAADYQRNTIALIPKDPLQRGSTYTATISARVTGKAWSRTWTFLTSEK